MANRKRASALVYLLGALCAGAIVAAILVVGPASGSQGGATRTATAALGVVQSTVSGSGNLQPASQLNLGFKTSGTVEHIYISQGQHVLSGQLLATLDPQSAEVTLEAGRAALQSAEANLAKVQETGGEGSGSGSSSPSGKAASAAATSTAPSSGAATPPAAATPAPATGTPAPTHTGTTKTSTTSAGTETGKAKEPERETVSAATREANLASAHAAVKSASLTVQGDEQAVRDTRLYAPEAGTIASLSGAVGETVSGGGTTRASSSSSSSSASSAAGGTAAAVPRSATSSSSTGSSASSSSSAFAVLANLSSMQLVVPLSESEVGSVRAGQPATVSVEALEGRKLAAQVSEVAILATSNSGVVSYDVTFELQQLEGGLKPGMSATAEVVVKQAEGVNIPTSAISRGTVTVLRGGTQTRRAVTTGLAGNSSTIILSGLNAGEQVLLPSVSTSTSSGVSSLRSRLGGLGGGGLGGLGGGAALLRGGG